jgi:E3 ubiquitin-protein ligase UBR2
MAKMPPGQGVAYEVRVMAICRAVIAYAYQLTSELNNPTRLPDFLSESNPKGEEDNAAFPDLSSERFCTVLFNDETHTFDIVIQTLTRALGCPKKDAIEFATIIDREGRSIVRVNKFSVWFYLVAAFLRFQH